MVLGRLGKDNSHFLDVHLHHELTVREREDGSRGEAIIQSMKGKICLGRPQKHFLLFPSDRINHRKVTVDMQNNNGACSQGRTRRSEMTMDVRNKERQTRIWTKCWNREHDLWQRHWVIQMLCYVYRRKMGGWCFLWMKDVDMLPWRNIFGLRSLNF